MVQHAEDYKWSSYRVILGMSDDKITHSNRTLGYFGKYPAIQYRQFVEDIGHKYYVEEDKIRRSVGGRWTMATMVKSFALQGIDGYMVDIETKTLEGQPMITIIGLGDQAVKESAERVKASIDEAGYVFPKKRVIISLAPSDKKKSGSHFDLAIAIGILMQNNDISVTNIEDYGFIGELSLDGRLRACRGVLPMIIAAQKEGVKKLVVPRESINEARLVWGIDIIGLTSLNEVIDYLEGKKTTVAYDKDSNIQIHDSSEKVLDFADVKGQKDIIYAVMLAAAGGHNMLMIGEPGCGKTMIAQRIPTILPEMTEEECLEVTKIYSIIGTNLERNKLM